MRVSEIKRTFTSRRNRFGNTRQLHQRRQHLAMCCKFVTHTKNNQMRIKLSISIVAKSYTVAIVRRTFANFQQRRLWVLKHLILSLNFPHNWGFPGQNFAFLEASTVNKNIFQQIKIYWWGQLRLAPCHDTSDRICIGLYRPTTTTAIQIITFLYYICVALVRGL